MSNKDFTLEDGMWRGDFEWETTDKKRVVFKRNPNGKFVVLPHEPAPDQPQKEWEIVAYRFDPLLPKEIIVNCDSNHWTDARENKNGDYSIFAVRRLSDGVVFTVGDRFSNNHCNIYTEHTIKEFRVCGSELEVWHEGGSYYPIFYVKKIPTKTPLFTTEDGKPVYEGGECWVVEKGEDYPYQWVQVVKEGMEDGLTLFSTKDAAYEYILMNKPCLSANDILRTDLNLNKHEKLLIWKDKIIELAKTKINK